MLPIVLAFWIGCSPSLPDPTVLAVDPPRGWNGEPTVVTITGSEFYPQVVFDASRANDADLDRGFAAWLVAADGGEHPLTAVDAESYDVIEAVVPEGLPVGVYALKVEGPTGRSDTLPAAFTVKDTRADRLAIVTDEVSFGVDEQADFRVELLDPDGERVYEDIGVEVAVVGEFGSVPVTWTANALEDQAFVGDGSAISGGATDGDAVIGIQVRVAGIVELSVTTTEDVGVSGDELRFEFTPANDLVVVFDPLGTDFEAVAGEPFEVVVELQDVWGNVIEEEHTIEFTDVCGSWSDVVAVTGRQPIAVGGTEPDDHGITQATDLDVDPAEPCLSQRVVARDVDDHTLGQSDSFDVLPADAKIFRVVALAAQVRAGDPLSVLVTALDPWGNRTDWDGQLTATIGASAAQGLVCELLDPLDPGAFICTVTPTVAGPGQVITVTGDDGITGTSKITVLPDDVATEVAIHAPTGVIAGEPFQVDFTLRDAWGNLVDGSLYDPSTFTVTQDGAPVSCTFDAVDILGVVHVDCTLFTAGTFDLVAAGPVGAPAVLTVDVTNGPLAVVALVAPSEIQAGQGVTIVGEGYDAFGNAYVEQADPLVELADASGTWSAPFATFAPDGTFLVAGTVTEAGVTALVASRGGLVLGTSADMEVVPGPAVAFDVLPLAPWAWVGEPFPVAIEARDGWGNVADWSGTADVSSRAGKASASVDVVGGYGLAELVWTGAALTDAVIATAGALDGESPAFHAVTDCAAGPTAVLTFQGNPVARACWDPVTGANLRGTLRNSVAGATPLTGYALALGLDTDLSPDPSVTVDAPGIGRHALQALVAQSDGCGAEVATTGWVGLADGQPVGPIPLAPDALAIDVVTGSTDLHLDGVLTCAGAPAVGGTVLVRTDLGDLQGVAPTGAGLAVTLDATGGATVTLDAGSADSGGAARVLAWTAAGTAAGEAFVDLVGDDREPTVWYQDPEGAGTGTVDDLRVTFSEPVADVDVADVELTGPLGPLPFAVSLADATTLVITPDQPLDLGAGPHVLVVGSSVQDLAGNGLDGAAFGSPTDWFGELGGPGAPVDAATCTPLLAAFRPDGDDGPGIDADRAPVALSSATRPDRWRMEVASASAPDVPLQVERVHAVGPFDVLSWDGRDAAGRVVPNGDYLLTITPLDAAGTPGPACSVVVAVDNAVVTP